MPSLGRSSLGRRSLTTAQFALLGFASLFFLWFVLLWLNIETLASGNWQLFGLSAFKKKAKYEFPDFNKYVYVRTLYSRDVGLDDPNRRVTIVGDVHGMNKSLHDLLTAIDYSPNADTLILSGDFLAKSTHVGSLAVLDFLAQRSPAALSSSRSGSNALPIHAVRGNHDNMVIQWRAWRDWFTPLHIKATLPSVSPAIPSYNAGTPVDTGIQFLELIEKEWEEERSRDPQGGVDPDTWADVARKRALGTWREEWWLRIPAPGKGHAERDWSMFTDHYWLARDVTEEQAQYLYSLPLVIHVPSAHFFVAHAGLLPYDPRFSPKNKRQPLAHPPCPKPSKSQDDVLIGKSEVPSKHVLDVVDDDPIMRLEQEQAILYDVLTNRDPWVILNMRGVTKKGKVTRDGDKGTPWSELWNDQMERCVGYGDEGRDRLHTDRTMRIEDRSKHDNKTDDAFTLPCRPSTVVYGHAASRDLDIKRWTAGLDTGCLYGRKLTALVLQHATPSEGEEDEGGDARFRSYALPHIWGSRPGSAADRQAQKKPKTWTQRIRFGEDGSGIDAHLVSVKCPRVGDLTGDEGILQISS